MGATTSRELPLPAVRRTRTNQGNAPCVAVLSAPGKRKCYSDRANTQETALPEKKRRVWYYGDAQNTHHCDIRRPEDDLMAFHIQPHILNRDLDVLANAHNDPPGVATNGALLPTPPLRNGLLDGLAAIHNAPCVLLRPLPPIQTLDDGKVECEFYQPTPLRPWQLIGSQSSHLVDLECMAAEVESRMSFLSDDGAMSEDFCRDLEEGSPYYGPSPCYDPSPNYGSFSRCDSSLSTVRLHPSPDYGSPPCYGLSSDYGSPSSCDSFQSTVRLHPSPDYGSSQCYGLSSDYGSPSSCDSSQSTVRLHPSPDYGSPP
ncbi:MAG: hypothetical protein M1813_005140 [Trichoglossum hirsutum]|nr:MAG: hypothetical protein M1813_005140 [Trichoglossum hirsutum]